MEYLYNITEKDLDHVMSNIDVKNIHIKFVQTVVLSTESNRYQIDPYEFADFIKENANIRGSIEYGIDLRALSSECADALYRMYIQVLGH